MENTTTNKTSLKEKINSLTTKCIGLAKNIFFKLLIYSLYILRYGSLVLFAVTIVSYRKYGSNIVSIQIQNMKINHKETLYDFITHWKGIFIANTKDVPLIKGYNYQIRNNMVIIYPFFRTPSFLFQNQYYDAEGILITENCENLNNITHVVGDNKQFLTIHHLLTPLKQHYDKLDLIFNGMRWDAIVYVKGQMITIKLPIEIDDKTKKKINYLTANWNKYINENTKIIDLRLGDKIYFVE